MKQKFNLRNFIYIFIGSQLIIYIAWGFIELSFLTPLIKTFETDISRGFYIMFLFCLFIITMPYYLIETTNKHEKN